MAFLRHSLIAIRGFLREGEVFEAVQTIAKGPDTSVHFLANLETLANIYVAIFNPEHQKWNTYPDSMSRSIQTLNFLNIRPFRPLMLAVAAKFSPKEASEAFQMFISWGVRLLIASSTRSGSVELPLATAANKIFSGDKETKISITQASELKKELKGIIPADEQFRQAFEVATVSKASLARYYLRSLEMAAKQEANPWFIPNDNKEVINLEHILPERPGDNWNQFGDELVRAYVKRLGNQTLLLAKSNSDLRSSDFETKKNVYKDSPYVLTKEISSVQEWNPVKIAERQKVLAQLALRVWSF